MTTTRTLAERLGPDLTRTWMLQEVLHTGVTAHQRVLIARTAVHGVTLLCDGRLKSSELTAQAYSEALTIPGLLLAGGRRRLLIIGASDGLAAQIAAEAGVAHVDHVDADRECVELCALLLPYGYDSHQLLAAAEGNGPIRARFADAHQVIVSELESGTRYDLIVLDAPAQPTGGTGYLHELYTSLYLHLCRDLLAPGGTVVAPAGCPTLWRQEPVALALDRFQSLFRTTVMYTAWELEQAFLLGSLTDATDPAAVMTDRLSRLPYLPQTLDAPALASGLIPPYHLRRPTAPIHPASQR
ncbi:hypothetical protein [Microbispora sp. NBRC 16548]|uniref:spermidine synthase n=1 Tax=Microbispora sp. NBRC 16548 TaxID=3030994 RepID=UPI0024A54F82|nr:hypothetical protein [Microbispora sp. NBRC 16548]GLX06615.1 polyamine aminopropyltransferase [Microbispora sp. NBRC 16548]